MVQTSLNFAQFTLRFKGKKKLSLSFLHIKRIQIPPLT